MEGRVVIVANGRVNHDNVMLVVVVEMANQLSHLLNRETLRIEGENIAAPHVIDICPHRFERDSSNRIVVYDLRNVENIPVSVTALMELVKSIYK